MRIETYENQLAKDLVTEINGRMANTAFAILKPNSRVKLTRGGRSPGMAMIPGRSRTQEDGSQNQAIISQMKQIASEYRPKGQATETILQDFHSLRQALNCASADQRLLIYIHTDASKRHLIEPKLKKIFNHPKFVGTFHLDFADQSVDRDWQEKLDGERDEPGILVIQSGSFGLNGKVVNQVPLHADFVTIGKAILKENQTFAQNEKRKHFEQHVRAGRTANIQFDNEISQR